VKAKRVTYFFVHVKETNGTPHRNLLEKIGKGIFGLKKIFGLEDIGKTFFCLKNISEWPIAEKQNAGDTYPPTRPLLFKEWLGVVRLGGPLSIGCLFPSI
jgi:hypothetical protein